MPSDSFKLLTSKKPALINRIASSGENGAAAMSPFSNAAARTGDSPMVRSITSLFGSRLYFLKKVFIANSEKDPAGYADRFPFKIFNGSRLLVAKENVIRRVGNRTDNVEIEPARVTAEYRLRAADAGKVHFSGSERSDGRRPAMD